VPKAKKSPAKTKAKPDPKPRRRPLRWLWRRVRWVVYGPILLVLLLVLAFRWINPPITHTMWVERARLGSIERNWVAIEDIDPDLPRAVVAAEDANYCLHWGFDVDAIKAALDAGANRGASTISQQVVKNVFLWQGRSWTRKALEAVLTPLVELAWPKQRILEVYLNVAEFDEGVFGVDAGALSQLGKGPSNLSVAEAGRLAVVLPNPKARDARNLSATQRRRAASVADGAETIRADGRSACFDP